MLPSKYHLFSFHYSSFQLFGTASKVHKWKSNILWTIHRHVTTQNAVTVIPQSFFHFARDIPYKPHKVVETSLSEACSLEKSKK
jgi:hypothetical protein